MQFEMHSSHEGTAGLFIQEDNSISVSSSG